MHKQRVRRVSGGRPTWRNANVRLPGSAIESILTLTEGGTGTGHFDADYLTSEYLSKLCLPGESEADLRAQNAVDKWVSVELGNANTNARLRARDPGYNILPRVSWSRFLSVARALVADVLGDLRDEIVLGTFTGGASTSRNRTKSHPAQKYVGQADITKEAVDFIELIHRLGPLLRDAGVFVSLREVTGARLFTVPKKTDIDRCACKEPDVNMFLQKGVGNHIRSRLRKFGISLNDQSVNRGLAREGSISGRYATLDLSSASDTLTVACVEALLPPLWFEYLNSIRSQRVSVGGTFFRTEMFSSMGNGFTFELESLIFWALMRTTAYFEGISGTISVYGDDIIIPSGMYNMATWVLTEFGFSANESKSFHTGPFRESCGGHYHHGVCVTPFYLKRPPTHLTDLIRVANQLRKWILADGSRQYVHPWAVEKWLELKSYVPSDLWGGRDLEVDTQLVSDDPPRRRLQRVTREKSLPQLGLYLHWHATNWNRRTFGDDPLGGSYEPREVTIMCRRAKAKPGAPYLDSNLFIEVEPYVRSSL